MAAKNRNSTLSNYDWSARRPRRALRGLTLLLAGAFVGACAEPEMHANNEQTPEPNVASPASLEIPALRTTAPDVALRNLNSQIAESERVLTSKPENSSLRTSLVGLLLARTQYIGTYSDFARADVLSRDGIEREPRAPEMRASRAGFLAAVHRFAEARHELELATSLGGTSEVSALTTLDLATGEALERTLQQRSELAHRFPSFRTVADRAAAEAALGRFEQADASYLEALALYRDVSPLPVAWLEFQRGVMWSEMADRKDLGEALYRKAVETLPDYVVANVHLAELQSQSGNREQAVARLERIRPLTEDPEPTAVLAKILKETSEERSQELASVALRRYEELLSRHEEAFRDHAAEFFSGAGNDPVRAVELAQKNLASRPTARAYIVALNAATAAADTALSCRLAVEASVFAATNRSLAAILEELEHECAER